MNPSMFVGYQLIFFYLTQIIGGISAYKVEEFKDAAGRAQLVTNHPSFARIIGVTCKSPNYCLVFEDREEEVTLYDFLSDLQASPGNLTNRDSRSGSNANQRGSRSNSLSAPENVAASSPYSSSSSSSSSSPSSSTSPPASPAAGLALSLELGESGISEDHQNLLKFKQKIKLAKHMVSGIIHAHRQGVVMSNLSAQYVMVSDLANSSQVLKSLTIMP
jgi:hypothetical protein